MKRRLACTLLLVLGAGAKAAPLPESWPESWRKAYVRFENFIAIRKKVWPAAELDLTPEGAITISADFSARGGLSLGFYNGGANWSAVGIPERSSEPLLMFKYVLPGRRALCVNVQSFQHAFPLLWFEPIAADWELFPEGPKRFRVVSAPEPADAYWPNERLLTWLDYHMLHREFPDDILSENRRVSPAALLQVDSAGVIHRPPMDDPRAEAALEWQLFYNGRRVKTGPAPREQATAPFGPGNYLALAGINGPAGFFPVSNLLRYTLAPDAKSRLTLFYQHYDYGNPADYPSWYLAILPPERGNGPARFADEKSFQRALALAFAWKGCSFRDNTPQARWIYHHPGKSPPSP